MGSPRAGHPRASGERQAASGRRSISALPAVRYCRFRGSAPTECPDRLISPGDRAINCCHHTSSERADVRPRWVPGVCAASPGAPFGLPADVADEGLVIGPADLDQHVTHTHVCSDEPPFGGVRGQRCCAGRYKQGHGKRHRQAGCDLLLQAMPDRRTSCRGCHTVRVQAARPSRSQGLRSHAHRRSPGR
jgi:hypothetical protein